MKSPYRLNGEALIRREGTSNQVERLDAGMLPDTEFDHIIREYLFRDLSDWPKWRRIKAEMIRDMALERRKTNGQDPVQFDTEDIKADALKDSQWENLKKLRSTAPEGADVTAYWVTATCGDYMQKLTKARVTLTFCGRKFQREFKI